MIEGYYKMVTLSDEVKSQNKIKSQSRLDCVLFAGDYKGLTNFVNAKGQLFLYKTQCREYIKANIKRRAEWSLTNNSLNFSSIYIEDFNSKNFGYGYPNGKQKLSNGDPNPLFPFKNDGYLFVINEDYTEVEIFVIKDGRNFITQYYQHLIDGEFEEEFQKIREKAKPFYNYIGLETGVL